MSVPGRTDLGVGPLEPFDERDNVQARNTLLPGIEEYRAYYAAHPQWESMDQEIRGLPGLGRVGSPRDLPLLGMEVETLLRLSGEDVVETPECNLLRAGVKTGTVLQVGAW